MTAVAGSWTPKRLSSALRSSTAPSESSPASIRGWLEATAALAPSMSATAADTASLILSLLTASGPGSWGCGEKSTGAGCCGADVGALLEMNAAKAAIVG